MFLLNLKNKIAGSMSNDTKRKIINLPIIRTCNKIANFIIDKKRGNLLSKHNKDVFKAIYDNISPGFYIWADCGTLLGIYRDKSIISHDIDMDFGVLYSQKDELLKLFKILSNQGFRLSRELSFNGIAYEYSMTYKGLNIDFILYDIVDNDLRTYAFSYLSNMLNEVTNVECFEYNLPYTKLTDINIFNLNVLIPENTEEYLKTLYGDNFMIPVGNYNWKENPIYKKVYGDFMVKKY